jgi:hypothetical protein
MELFHLFLAFVNNVLHLEDYEWEETCHGFITIIAGMGREDVVEIQYD